MMHWYGGWGGGSVSLLFWVLVIAAVVLVARAGRNSGYKKERPSQESAMEILDRRYAAGELSKEEYSHMKETLRK